MADPEYEFASQFNERYSLVSRKIVRKLSENSRAKISELGNQIGISRQAVSKRLDRLEKELGIRYVLDLNEDKLGLTSPHLIVANFKNRPDDDTLKGIFQRSAIPQAVVSTKGDYDLIIYANAASRNEYVHWDMNMQIALAKYGLAWRSSEVTHRQLGFFPLRNEILDRLNIPVKYKEMLKLLNTNSNVSFKDMSTALGIHFNSIEYRFKKLLEMGYINRFTVTMAPPKEVFLMSFVCKYSPGDEHERNSANARKAFMSDDKDSLVSRYVLCSQLIGSYDFCTIGAFDNYKAAYDMDIKFHKYWHRKSGIKLRFAQVEKVLLGSLAVNSLDTRKEYKTIKWTMAT